MIETVKKEETEPTNETDLISNNISQCVSYVILVGAGFLQVG